MQSHAGVSEAKSDFMGYDVKPSLLNNTPHPPKQLHSSNDLSPFVFMKQSSIPTQTQGSKTTTVSLKWPLELCVLTSPEHPTHPTDNSYRPSDSHFTPNKNESPLTATIASAPDIQSILSHLALLRSLNSSYCFLLSQLKKLTLK